MTRRILLVILALLLLGTLAACAPPTPAPVPSPAPAPTAAPVPGTAKLSYHWRLSAPNPAENPMTQADRIFAKKILDDSGGRIVIDVKDSGVLGDWIPVIGEVMQGSIELSNTPISSVYDPRLEFIAMPYLTMNWREIKLAFAPGGFVFDTTDSIARTLGYVVLSSMCFDPVGMSTSKLPNKPGDPDVPKNLKIRIYASKVAEILMKRMGYMPTVMPFTDVFAAMQTGVVDGVFGAGVTGTYANIRDVVKYWIPYNMFPDNYFFIMNLKLFNSLSAEDQKIVKGAALERQDAQMIAAEAQEVEYTQKLKDYGIQVVSLTDDELKKISAAVAKDVWPEMVPIVGKKLLDDALAYVQSIRK